jgi:cytochrome P450
MFSNRFQKILGFIIGAQDTTATSVTWALKYLADNPHFQTKLRAELRGAHADAASEKRLPTFGEITKTPIHYRDAVVEEIFRCSLTEASAVRTAVVDTEVLGCFIPKGTEVFLMGNGPSFLSPEFEIQDSLRTKSCLESKDKVGAWKHGDMAIFNPDRWLVEDASGELVFEAAAGPLLTFGLGERSCYGRRMAYLQMKQLMTLIVWNFELHKCSKELSGYEASDKMAHSPQFCYIRPVKIVY